MELQIEFDITIDGITPNEFVDWYKYNPNSGSSYSFEYEGESFPIGEVYTQPRPSHPIYRVDIFVIYCNEAIFRSLGLSEEEIKKRMNDLKLENTEEVDGKLIINPLWDSVRTGILTVLPFGSGCQVVGQSISNPIVVKNIGIQIQKVFRERAHNNLDSKQLNIDDYKMLKGLYKDLIGRHIETLENQNEDREIVRRVINLRDQRIASLQEKISKSNKDSDHYAWPDPKDRKKIVDEYRAGKVSGEIKNKELWAQSNYHIGAKTLKAYEDEFPIGNVTIPNNS